MNASDQRIIDRWARTFGWESKVLSPAGAGYVMFRRGSHHVIVNWELSPPDTFAVHTTGPQQAEADRAQDLEIEATPSCGPVRDHRF